MTEQRERRKYFKDLSRKDYIERAYEILEKEGVEAISIRRMAREFGCSSTSMYRYFTNVEELIYYANLIYLDEYLRLLNQKEKEWKDIWDQHIGIWECYSRVAFSHPQAFNVIFFSGTSKKLTEALREFYELFPERINIVSPYLQVMLQSADLLERDMVMVKRCVEAGVVPWERAAKLNHMVCFLYKGYLKDILDYGIAPEAIGVRVRQFCNEIGEICWSLATEQGRQLLEEKRMPASCIRDRTGGCWRPWSGRASIG